MRQADMVGREPRKTYQVGRARIDLEGKLLVLTDCDVEDIGAEDQIS